MPGWSRPAGRGSGPSPGRVVDVRRVSGQQDAPAGSGPPAAPRRHRLSHASGVSRMPKSVPARRSALARSSRRGRLVSGSYNVASSMTRSGTGRRDRHHVHRPARLVQGERRACGGRPARCRPGSSARCPGSLEIDPGRVADHARGAVAADRVGGADDRRAAGESTSRSTPASSCRRPVTACRLRYGTPSSARCSSSSSSVAAAEGTA